MTTTELRPARSGIAVQNIQEVLDAHATAHGAASVGQAQYLTRPDFAEECYKLLLARVKHDPYAVVDPQCGTGNLLTTAKPKNYWRKPDLHGIDIDNRINQSDNTGINLVTGNCVKAAAALDDMYPGTMFSMALANPPFGTKLRMPDGNVMDSTEWTWKFCTEHANSGYFIANQATILKLGLDKHPWVFHSLTRQGSELWDGMRDTLVIGVVFWQRPIEQTKTCSSDLHNRWNKVKAVLLEEEGQRQKFNISLNASGLLRTYLSIRVETKHRLTREDIIKLHKIDKAHPLTLTTERETRDLLNTLVNGGIYSVSPEAKAAIDEAIKAMHQHACPIMPVTDFEAVAYADEQADLTCVRPGADGLRLTPTRKYKIDSRTYRFVDSFTRNKPHFNEETGETYTVEHACTLTGTDRLIAIRDDSGREYKFMDRPDQKDQYARPESDLWKYFDKPAVKTVTDAMPQAAAYHQAILKSCEMMAGYKYYPGQLPYLAAVAIKDYALIAAETGAGKSLMALSLIALKSPERCLIIAPQGTMRSTESDDDEDGTDYNASQWVQEIHQFAPHLQVWELFNYEDYLRILAMNGGVLPPGVYITYYEAFFSNGGRETAASKWDDVKLQKEMQHITGTKTELPYPDVKTLGGSTVKKYWCDSVGRESNGIRCIIKPCLSTLIGHHFDAVMLDEAHRCTNLGANITQMLIRLQPKYRYALTATPIPDRVTNLFSLMGWLCVEDWYKGNRRNVAWPYTRDELPRFAATFLTEERDLTQEELNKAANPDWVGVCSKKSPVIASPARLLKLLKPSIAYISKEACNPKYQAPKIVDVRVKLGQEQAKLYGHFTDRSNIPASHPLVRARKQSAWLRSVCADPKGFAHHTEDSPVVTSNMNPKVIAILELVRDILARGEQVVIINSRVGISDALQDRLTEAGVTISRIDSTLTADRHSREADLFKSGKTRVMLMGIRCAAAYSFSQCGNEIIGSLEYSPGPFNQAKGRVDRVNSRPGVVIYCILHKNSIEEIMFDTTATKDDAATICLKGRRTEREFKPVDGSELLAMALSQFDLSGAMPESECEEQWPALRDAIRKAGQTPQHNAA